MSLILEIETATTVCSVALSRSGTLLACREIEQRNVHAEKITVFIDDVLSSAGVDYHELDAIAVSCGPGSYTGLRIGVSAAKGLCFALDKPLIAVETLEAMTSGMIQKLNGSSNENTLLCPMIDARRMEVFTAVFDGQANRIKPTSAEIVGEDSFADLLQSNKVIFFGDGAGKCGEVLEAHANATVIDDFTNSAAFLVRKATKKFLAGEFEDVAYFEPFYLKDFIAGKRPA
ncbi:MAG: tRNA (adenosine(37)-N6)-threonylcarbamoyltransferase complex dimerization subunit type 1 TsaB [Bacteroidetes bacterium]|nr:tRNA (adenosine(37)-N6)-threonylcarbamoyltransferase complex dimerization subunit type 1 TsaB [Bacteroidota bacterium]